MPSVDSGWTAIALRYYPVWLRYMIRIYAMYQQFDYEGKPLDRGSCPLEERLQYKHPLLPSLFLHKHLPPQLCLVR